MPSPLIASCHELSASPQRRRQLSHPQQQRTGRNSRCNHVHKHQTPPRAAPLKDVQAHRRTGVQGDAREGVRRLRRAQARGRLQQEAVRRQVGRAALQGLRRGRPGGGRRVQRAPRARAAREDALLGPLLPAPGREAVRRGRGEQEGRLPPRVGGPQREGDDGARLRGRRGRGHGRAPRHGAPRHARRRPGLPPGVLPPHGPRHALAQPRRAEAEAAAARRVREALPGGREPPGDAAPLPGPAAQARRVRAPGPGPVRLRLRALRRGGRRPLRAAGVGRGVARPRGVRAAPRRAPVRGQEVQELGQAARGPRRALGRRGLARGRRGGPALGAVGAGPPGAARRPRAAPPRGPLVGPRRDHGQARARRQPRGLPREPRDLREFGGRVRAHDHGGAARRRRGGRHAPGRRRRRGAGRGDGAQGRPPRRRARRQIPDGLRGLAVRALGLLHAPPRARGPEGVALGAGLRRRRQGDPRRRRLRQLQARRQGPGHVPRVRRRLRGAPARHGRRGRRAPGPRGAAAAAAGRRVPRGPRRPREQPRAEARGGL